LSKTSISFYQSTWCHITVRANRRKDGSLKKYSVFTCFPEGKYKQLRPACCRNQWSFRSALLAIRLQGHVICSMEEDVLDGGLSCGLQSLGLDRFVFWWRKVVCSIWTSLATHREQRFLPCEKLWTRYYYWGKNCVIMPLLKYYRQMFSFIR
jgi:hypothetical protein